MKTSRKALGTRIKSIRKKLRMTQEQFCRDVDGASSSAISTYEVGDAYPPIETLIRIAKAGEKSIDWMLFGCEMPNTSRDITEEELRLLQLFRMASKDDKNVILRVANALQKQDKNK